MKLYLEQTMDEFLMGWKNISAVIIGICVCDGVVVVVVVVVVIVVAVIVIYPHSCCCSSRQ
jgi:hypothetical protein